VSTRARPQWLTYTIAVPSAGAYVVEVRYRASIAGASLRVARGDAAPSEAASLPDSAGAWTTSQITTLDLPAGVDALRLLVDEGSAGLQISSLTLRGP
jgi:hypothetical protein